MRARAALLFVALLAAGCSGTALGDLASMAGVGGSSGNGPEGAVSPPALTGSTSSCYEGTWALQPETAWSTENLRRMGIGGRGEFEYVGSEGDAWLTLQPDGTYEWSLNRFAVTLRGDADTSTPTEVTVNMHGMLYGTAEPGSGARSLDMANGSGGTPPARMTAFATVESGGIGSLGRINLNVERLLGANAWTSTYACSSGALELTTQDGEGGALQNARYLEVR